MQTGNREQVRMALLAAIILACSASCTTKKTIATSPVEAPILRTSICQLLDQPKSFKGMIVAVQGEFIHDGMHGGILIDTHCSSRGVLAWGAPLAEILRHGCLGTIDKIVTGTWVGKYYGARENTDAVSAPRGLEVTTAENLVVLPRPGAPKCGN